MSIMTMMSLVLVVGFLATALVGFFGWRQRMREEQVSPRNQSRLRRDPDGEPQRARDDPRGVEGACL